MTVPDSVEPDVGEVREIVGGVVSDVVPIVIVTLWEEVPPVPVQERE